MDFNNPQLAPGTRRWLVPRHLDRLRPALQRPGGQTRAEVARTLAQLAASFVGEAVSAALAAPDYRAPREPWPPRDRSGSILNPFDDPAVAYDDDLAYGREEDHLSP